MAYLCCLPSGRSINIFVYDGLISQAVAFGDLLNNGESFAKKLLGAFNSHRSWPQIVHIATDGETYGHYRRQGNIALANCVVSIDSSNSAVLTNYGQYLQKHPPTHMIEIVENSSWSCAHGIERWRADCGCHSGIHPGWTQAWRNPLREAMDWLGDRVAAIYDKEAGLYLRDPWEAREDYIELMLDRSPERVEGFFARHLRDKLAGAEQERVLTLLEMQKNALLVYTSCGWFFDDIAGIEAVQVMRYAARAMQLAEEVQEISLEPDYRRILATAPSNVHENGARTYDLLVKAARMDPSRVIAR